MADSTTTKASKAAKNGSAWKNDPLREVLKKDIMDGTITPFMKPSEAIKLRPEYAAMGNRLFGSRLITMRVCLSKEAKGTSWILIRDAAAFQRADITNRSKLALPHPLDLTAMEPSHVNDLSRVNYFLLEPL